jgi:hypothetical protein
MKELVGLVLGPGSVRAVVVRGAVVVWSGERSLTNDEPLRATLRELLASAPRRRRRRIGLGVVVESPHAQVRRLEGLPSLDGRLTARLVRENAPALFLKRDAGLAVAKVHCVGGAVWGAALDRNVVADVTAVARELRFVPRGIAAASEFLNRSSAHDLPATAASVDARTPLVWTRDQAGDVGEMRPRRVILAGLGVVGVALASAAATIARDAWEEKQMLRELAVHRTSEAEARRALSELRRVSTSLDERRTFDSKRGRLTGLIQEVASVLPESTAIVSLHVDSLDVNLVVLGPRLTEVVPALAGTTPAQSARIVGAVSHEVVDGAPFQRAATRFRRPTDRRR